MSKKKRNSKRKQVSKKTHGKMMMGQMPDGNVPAGFTLKLAANFGTEEDFVVRVWIQIKDILKYIRLPNDDEIDFRFDRVVEQLDIARVHLARIEDKNFHSQPTFDQQAEYVAFYNSVWWAYKDRFQLFMKELGFDIGFIFQDEKNYEKGSTKFVKDHPDAAEFIDVARNDRKSWQNVLATHRNTLHSGDRRNQKHDLDNPSDARMIFDNIWQAIEENFLYLGEKVMDDSWTIVRVPEEHRDKNVPVHYRAYPKGLLDGSIKLPPLDSAPMSGSSTT